MKRTTYYIIGIPIVLLLLMMGVMVYVFTLSVRWEDTFYVVGGEAKHIPLPACSRVCFEKQLPYSAPPVDSNLHSRASECEYSFTQVPLNVFPTDSMKPYLVLPADMAKHLMTELRGDTLFFSFNFPQEQLPETLRGMELLKLKSDTIQLFIPSSVECLESRIYGMDVILDGLSHETFSVYSQASVKVKRCQFTDFYPNALSYVSLMSGSVKNLYQVLDDFDGVLKVHTDSFNIENEILSSRHKALKKLEKDECQRVVWEPKSDDAELVLTLTISEASEIGVR